MAIENGNRFVSIERLEQLVDEVLGEGAEFRTKRSPTLLKLDWLAERLRKAERIKAQIAAGTYHVDSEDVAKAILCHDLQNASKRAK